MTCKYLNLLLTARKHCSGNTSNTVQEDEYMDFFFSIDSTFEDLKVPNMLSELGKLVLKDKTRKEKRGGEFRREVIKEISRINNG